MGAIEATLEVLFGVMDPATAHRYYVLVENELVGSFIECSGIAARREVLEIREGGVNTHTHKLPGRISYGTLTLKKGVVFSNDMHKWFYKGETNIKVKKTSMTVIHFSNYFVVPARWYNVYDVYPVAWQVSDFAAASSTYAVETLEVAFSTIEMETLADFALLSQLTSGS